MNRVFNKTSLPKTAGDAKAGATVVTLTWLFMMTTFAQFRERHADELWESGGIDLQVKFQAASWIALGLLAVYLMQTGRADLSLLRRGPLFWYSWFIVACIGSAAVSQSPALTVFRSCQLGVAMVLVVALRDKLKYVYFLGVVYCVVNMVLAVMATTGLHFGQDWITGPDDIYVFGQETGRGETYRFASPFGHPSIISIVAAISACGILSRLRTDRWLFDTSMLLILVVTCLLTVSRTAIAGMFLGFVIIAWGRRWLVFMALSAGLLAPLCLLHQGVRDQAVSFMMRGQDARQVASLTGRDVIWAAALKRIEASFPFGEGFQGGRVELLDDEGSWVGITHAHNLILECLIGVGLHGAIFAAVVLVAFAANAYKVLAFDRQQKTIGLEMLSILLPVVAFCTLDRGFAAEMNPFCLIFLAMLARSEQAVREVDLQLNARRKEQAALSNQSRWLRQLANKSKGRFAG